MADLSEALSEARSRIDDLERERSEARSNFDRLRRRKVVRLALAVAVPAALLRRGAARAAAGLRSLVPRQALLARRLRRERVAVAGFVTKPVSIVIPTHDGAHHLSRLFDALQRHSTGEIELIVVDNASTDETTELVRAFSRWPITLISNHENRSFSEACNQGAHAASHGLILFLNNDVEPINEGWLAAMVEAIDPQEVAAVGALLVYPDGRQTSSAAQAPLTLQHRGIAFSWSGGAPRPVNLGLGESPVGRSGAPYETPAATAACLLVRRDRFEEVGGFDDGYRYGWEDTDLCMRLRASGNTVVVAPDAALFHYEFGTQEAVLSREVRAANHQNNSTRFAGRWAPRLRRLRSRDLLERSGFWAADPTGVVAITVTDLREDQGFGDWYTAHELGDALERAGWEVAYIERRDDAWHDDHVAADIVISLLPHYDPRQAPAGAMTVAWVRNWVDRWVGNPGFDSYTLVLASTDGFVEQIELQSTQSPTLMPLATNPDRFRPADTARAGAVITANAWGSDRDLAVGAASLDVPLDIYGRGWEKSELAQRSHGPVPYSTLPEIYAGAALVLDDTVEPNRPAVNARVFDALASGALVLSDSAAGSDEWFDGLLPTWSDATELHALIHKYLENESERSALATQLGDLVRDRHTYGHRAGQLLGALRRTVESPAVDIRISPPDRRMAPRWGDTHFAADLARALRRRGLRTTITTRDAWEAKEAQGSDVVLALRGLHRHHPQPGALNLVWVISHPESIEDGELAEYDSVFVAGERLVERFRLEHGIEAELLLQATDPARFAPGPPDDRLAVDVLFVGNSRGVDRPIVQTAISAGLEPTIYGQGWDDLVPARMVAADAFPNADLPALYRSAKAVLNDHWPDMARAGILSNRLFDAVACGAAVVSDNVDGIEEVFGEAVARFTDADDLVEAVETAGARLGVANAAVRAIARNHNFDVRAAMLLATMEAGDRPELGRPAWPARNDPPSP